MSDDRQTKRVVVYTSMLSEQASVWIRIIAPIRQAGWNFQYGMDSSDCYAELENADLVIMQREYPVLHSNWRNVVNTSKKLKIPVIFDIDDLLFDVPVEHIDYPFSQILKTPLIDAMRFCDAITVSTEALADQVKDFGKLVRVVPNFLDDGTWPQVRKQQILADACPPLLIGYAATATHRADLDMIGETLERIGKQHGSKVHFAFWGISPPPHLRRMPNVKWHLLNKPRYPEYADFMCSQKLDIAIAPLRDNRFNKCKSAIKYLEYAWMKIPAIYSKLAPYESVVQHNTNGLLAYTMDEWYAALSCLIESRELRQSISNAAHSLVVENHLLSSEADTATLFWSELMSCTAV